MGAIKPYLTYEDGEALASDLAGSSFSDIKPLETGAPHDVASDAQVLRKSAVKRLQRPIQEITSVSRIANDHRSSHDRSSLIWRNMHSPVNIDGDMEASSWETFQAVGGESSYQTNRAVGCF